MIWSQAGVKKLSEFIEMLGWHLPEGLLTPIVARGQ